jgi:hypothetical protein
MADRDPARILDTLFASWRTDALNAAIDLGVFTALGRARRTARQLGRACQAGPEDIRTLCDYLTGLGLLCKRGDVYWCSRAAVRFLDGRSPDSLAAIPRFLDASRITSALARLAEDAAPPGTAAVIARLRPSSIGSTSPPRRSRPPPSGSSLRLNSAVEAWRADAFSISAPADRHSG